MDTTSSPTTEVSTHTPPTQISTDPSFLPHSHLLLKASATPTTANQPAWVTPHLREPCDFTSKNPTDPRLHQLAEAYSTILSIVGEDLSRGGIINTPMRAAKAIMELTVGNETVLEDIVNGAVFEEDCHDLVMVRDIEFTSLCEHHLLPFRGKIHVGYYPCGKILGLSKFARIADCYSRRLQVQERLTKQICSAIDHVVEPLGVVVVCEAEHSCMSCRGVKKSGSSTITMSQTGCFRDPKYKEEFLQLLNRASQRY